jgi:iron complex transport system ATP-binding protein
MRFSGKIESAHRMKPVLEVSGLCVRRGESSLLQDVHWHIHPGEHWVLLGANGSGKTSLLKALTGYLSPSAGEYSVLGQRYGASDWRELRLKIGVVTSAFTASIPPAETALETVMSGKFAQLDLWARVNARDRKSAAKLLSVVDAEALAERPWLYLSQGERQRVLIARALMARPRLLILDEPCAGLDPIAREHFLQLVNTLASHQERSGRAMALVLVTHHVEEITSVFTHALLLRRGRVMAAGPCESILTSRNLAQTFGAPLKLSRSSNGRYALTVLSQ